MNRREYFLKACRDEMFRHKRWVITHFSETYPSNEQLENPTPYLIFPGETHYMVYLPDEQGQLYVEMLDDAQLGLPPFVLREGVDLKAGDVPNLKRDVTTTYGNILFNYVVLVWPFGDKIDFITGEIKLKKHVESEIDQRLTTDGTEPRAGIDSPIYVSEYLNYVDAAQSLVGYTQLCVPSATRKTMTVNPDILKRRDELLEQYKDQLNDPAIVAKIDKELVDLDREWMKGDLGEGFYFKDKFYNVVRKKSHIFHGAESGFKDGPDVDVVRNSLAEGWEIDKLPAMVNSLREGSYSRSTLTALGGESAKTLNRIFQNTRVEQEDCGSRLGWKHRLTGVNHRRFIGFHRITQNGTELLTEDNISKFIDKTVTLRTPMFCKTPKTGFCQKCVGEQIAQSPNAIGSLVAAVGSRFLDIFMAKMHGTELTTAEYKPENSIS